MASQLPAKGSKLASTTSEDVSAKDYVDMLSIYGHCKQVFYIGTFLLATFKGAIAKKTRKHQLSFLEYVFFLLNKHKEREKEREILPNCISFLYKSAVSNTHYLSGDYFHKPWFLVLTHTELMHSRAECHHFNTPKSWSIKVT